jgi:hypothetical protein
VWFRRKQIKGRSMYDYRPCKSKSGDMNKYKRFALILLIAVYVLFVLSSWGFGQNEALMGRPSVSIFVDLKDDKYKIMKETVRTDTELQIRMAGIRILPLGTEHAETAHHITLVIYLDIRDSDIRDFRQKIPQLYTYSVEVYWLKKRAAITRQGRETGSTPDIFNIRNIVKEEVGRLIKAYLFANPKDEGKTEKQEQ